MTPDIVERLRSSANFHEGEDRRITARDLREAAAEIERLHAEIEARKTAAERVYLEQAAEIERLRKSCKSIALDKDVVIERLRATVSDQAAVIERLTREKEDPHHGLGRGGMKLADLLPELAVIRQVMKDTKP